MALAPRVRRLLSAERTPIPRHLSDITTLGDECPARDAALSEPGVEAIWRATKALYRGGMSPGIGLCLRRRGQVFLDRGLGYADLESGRLLTPNTPVCLFSASKSITAMLVHHLVEQGLVNLDDPVTRYLPAYGQQGKGDTTLRHLLTHRAGIPRPDQPVEPDILFRPREILDLLCAARPTAFGAQAYHAITAGFVLGAVVEAVTGESLNATLDRVIRQPMGMRYFTYGGTGPERARDVVTGMPMKLVDLFLNHAVGGTLDAVVRVTNDERFQNAVIPAGNLYATAEEASRFFQMLLNGGVWNGQRLFREETVAQALQPASRRPRFDRTLMLPLNFSAGFMLGNRGISLFGPAAPRAFGHLGFISIYCWADPQRKLSGALLTTGKGLIGPHLPALLSLQHTINRVTRR
ncbi:serine hydrolase domain-containing protein [Alloalcanivorax mobilis]|uniref:serine hydrolase domain-containing protein n=1 Tax=Alloalcanivorax mobilis TaxID=2019569 RepID=UPI000C777A44|nr:serine hydrolase domain-containing protein [Alloalcanivorax mobilis]